MKDIYFIHHTNTATKDFISTAFRLEMSAEEAIQLWEHHWKMVNKHNLV